MKDQKSLDEKETAYEKWDRAKGLMLESLYKPDNHLRSCAHNQECYNELMEIRDHVLNMIQSMSCLLYTSPSPRDLSTSRMPSSA